MNIDNIVLFDAENRDNFLPLAFTRSIADFRIGILTIKEKWEILLSNKVDILTQNYLQLKYNYKQTNSTVFINASFLPNSLLFSEIEKLENNTVLKSNNHIIAIKTATQINSLEDLYVLNTEKYTTIHSTSNAIQINFNWDIFSQNGNQIESDIKLLKLQANADKLSTTNQILGHQNIYIGNNVQAEFATLNATKGSIFIGNNAEIMEGSMVRGSFALCNDSTLKMGAKIYGDTTIGPHSKVGGEVSNSVIFGYSNKAHDGFLGNAVIGEWCNLGADTNNSNLKNNYSFVKIWNYKDANYIDTLLQFCGLIMGDHSKSAINTMFNTGTVVGVAANIFGSGFPPKFIPDFVWGGANGFEIFDYDKAIDIAKKVMQRRNIEFTKIDEAIFAAIFENTKLWRNN